MQKLRILLIDDHEIFRQGIRALLAGRTDSIVSGEAGTAEEGLEKVESLKPDIVTLDISLPDRSDAIREGRDGDEAI